MQQDSHPVMNVADIRRWLTCYRCDLGDLDTAGTVPHIPDARKCQQSARFWPYPPRRFAPRLAGPFIPSIRRNDAAAQTFERGLVEQCFRACVDQWFPAPGRPRALTRPTGINPQRIRTSAPSSRSTRTSCPGAIFRRSGSSTTVSQDASNAAATSSGAVSKKNRPGIMSLREHAPFALTAWQSCRIHRSTCPTLHEVPCASQ